MNYYNPLIQWKRKFSCFLKHKNSENSYRLSLAKLSLVKMVFITTDLCNILDVNMYFLTDLKI